MGIINDLTGGFLQKEKARKKYSLFMQFDDDEPIEYIKNIDVFNSVHLEIVYSEDGTNQRKELVFTCKTTGKKFKLYSQ